MSRKPFLTVSLLFLLTMVAGAAYAGPNITSKSYWPNEVGPSSYRTTQTDANWRRAGAGLGAARFQTAPQARRSGQGCRWAYRGGPKSPITCER